jgi:hypothetical protein
MSFRIWLPVLALSAAVQAQSPPFDTLTPEQQAAVKRGEPVQVLQTVSTSSWPRSIVYVFIDATPEESAAVLSDYEIQSSFVPHMKSSKIIARHGANDTDVEYVIDIPVFPDERSVSRQWVSGANGEYQVHWKTVFADSLKPDGSRTVGLATFLPFTNAAGHPGTLVIHDQTVVPNSVFASVPFVKRKGIQVSIESAMATARQVEMERSKEPKQLAAQVRRFREALAAPRDSAKVIR